MCFHHPHIVYLEMVPNHSVSSNSKYMYCIQHICHRWFLSLSLVVTCKDRLEMGLGIIFSFQGRFCPITTEFESRNLCLSVVLKTHNPRRKFPEFQNTTTRSRVSMLDSVTVSLLNWVNLTVRRCHCLVDAAHVMYFSSVSVIHFHMLL